MFRLRFASLTRLTATVPVAAAVTLGLCYFMVQLVQSDAAVPEAEPPTKISPVVLEPEEIETRPEPPPEPEPVEAPPPISPPQTAPPAEQETLHYSLPAPPVEPIVDGERFFSADGQLVTLTKVQPHYPARQITRGVEGYVDVRFDVTATGATDNIRVIASEPQGVFDREVVRAVKQWKYRPRVVDGKPRPSYNVTERVSFKLDKH